MLRKVAQTVRLFLLSGGEGVKKKGGCEKIIDFQGKAIEKFKNTLFYSDFAQIACNSVLLKAAPPRDTGRV